jgi:hypothetical protein
MVAEGPAMRMFDRMQQDMIEDDLAVMAHVVQAASETGRLPPDVLELVDIQAVAPTLAVRDRLQDAQADQILVRNQAMSVETMAARHGLSPDHEQQLIARRADVREANYNPNEPRDRRGRWTIGAPDDGPADPGRIRYRAGPERMGVEYKGGPSGTAAPSHAPSGAGPGGAKAAPSRGPYSPEEAKKLFDKEKARSDIAFKYPADGCYARAHLMAEDIKKAGGNPGKVWAFAKDGADPLHVDTPHDPAGHVEWGYHVAPTVPVQGKDGKETNMVVDPSMFDRPVTVGEWNAAMAPRGGGGISNSFTKIGEAPVLPDGTRAKGSGYWPGDDPGEGIEKNASDTMKDYKRREYTPPPAAVPTKP